MYNCNKPQCCGSCSCNNSPPCGNTPCKSQITEADLGTLIYVKGLDVNLCTKYQAVANILGLRDCAGNLIAANTQIVTCATFQDRLCDIFAALPDGGTLSTGDVVVGADCQTYTVPALQGALTVNDTATVDLTLLANVLTADVNVSPNAGNILEELGNGLYVDIDSADLCNALSGLTPGAVAGAGTVLVGADCQTHALPALQAPLTFNDSSSVDFTQAGNNVTASVIISPNAGNQITNPGNGIYAPASNTPITPVDTLSVNLTASGTDNHTLQADVIISPTAGNQLELLANGLHVSTTQADVCTALSTVATGAPAAAGTLLLGDDCLYHAFPNLGPAITVDDTVTVDLTLAAGEITADVNVSAIPGNLLSIQGDGLAVTCAAVNSCVSVDVNITAVDTATVNTTVNEGLPNNFTVQGDVIVSPNAGNALSALANGLYVTPGTVDCVTIQALFPDEGNILQAGDEILIGTCETKEFPSFVGGDTSCIDTSVIQQPSGDIVISSTPILNPTNNGLTCTPTGLLAPPNTAAAEAEITLGTLLVNGALINGQVVASPLITLNIANPSTTRDALLTVEMIIPAVTWNSTVDFGSLTIQGNHAFNLPGFLVTALGTFTTWEVMGATAVSSGTPPASRIQGSWIVPPSFVGSYSVQWNVTMSTGAASLANVGNVGARYTLSAID